MSVSVTMDFKETVLCAMVRAQILPGQIHPKDRVQFDLLSKAVARRLKPLSHGKHPRIRT